MTFKRTATVAFVAALGMTSLAACGNDDSGSGSTGSGSAAAAKRACIMLPDADSSSRWENGDRPALESSFKKIGFETDIQNALNDTGKYATLADQQLTKGCSVMLLVDLNGAGAQVMDKAHAQGVPVIAYDRPIKGADYYVSFDNFHVGELEGQMIVDGLKAEGKDAKTAKVVYSGGDPTDGNAAQFQDGADKVMTAAGIKPAFKTPGTWDQQKSQTYFEQAYTKLNGTVYKPYQLEAKATVDLGQQLLKGQKPAVSKKAPDGTPFIAETPSIVTTKNMQQGFDDGNAKVTD